MGNRDVAVQAGDGRGMSRRQLIAAMAALGAAPAALSSCAPPTPSVGPPPGMPDTGPFPDGVMAGDPLPDGAVIWTRLVRPADAADRAVTWMVGDDESMSVLRAGGTATASADADHCVKVLVSGLQPDRWYWYRFETDAGASRVGRLRTSPAPEADVDHLRFAFGSCQQINDHSWFAAHRNIVDENVDFLMHLGDYVYVSDEGTVSLEDYRSTYRRWHRQPLLRDLQAQVPIVAMWDDGEFVNGVDSTMPEPRFSHAKQAWFDHFPVLDPGGREPQRSFSWGALADIFMIDVRAHRDPPVLSARWEPTRTTLGGPQFRWLTDGLTASAATWRLIGNPYNINVWKLLDLEWLRGLDPSLPPDVGVHAPNEAWDNFARERRDLLAHLRDNGVTDTAFCSGHTHVAMAADLRPAPGSPVIATDVVAGSMTADPDVRRAYFEDLPTEVAEAIIGVGEDWIIGQNPDMGYINLIDQGWVTVDVTPEETTFSIRRVDTAREDATATTIATFRVVRGRPGLERVRSSERGAFG